jgi:hypothetical protein
MRGGIEASRVRRKTMKSVLPVRLQAWRKEIER